jgi:hypothetical protein
VIAMSIIAGVAKAAAGAKMLTRTRPTTWVFPKTKWTLVVMAVDLLALLAAFAALIPASEAPTPITSTRRAVGTISRGQRLR